MDGVRPPLERGWMFQCDHTFVRRDNLQGEGKPTLATKELVTSCAGKEKRANAAHWCIAARGLKICADDCLIKGLQSWGGMISYVAS